MRYFDRTFFKFLFGLGLIIVLGLFFINKVSAQAIVNINTASSEELQTLNGIGPTIAQRIIDYRTASGPFVQIEDIKSVSGIGDSTFNKIKDYITVGEVTQSNQQSKDDNKNVSDNVTDTNKEVSSSSVEVESIKVSAYGEKIGVVGQPLEFRAESSSKKATITWIFGDGALAYGQVVTHAYEYPGEYVVVLTGSISGKKSVSRLNIKIVPDTLSISNASNERIEITNSGKDEISLYGREIQVGQNKFVFPEGTFIRPNQKISFSSKVTNLYPTDKSQTILLVTGTTGVQKTTYINNQKQSNDSVNKISLIRDKQTEIININQAASINLAQATQTSISAEKTIKRDSWLTKVRHFFGFK